MKRISNISQLQENVINLNKLNLDGSFAFKIKKNNYYYCVRDKVGTLKLFYGVKIKNNKLTFSNSYIKLLKVCKKNSIYSVDKGAISKFNTRGEILQKVKFTKYKNFKDLSQKKKNIITKIKIYLREIKKKHGETCIILLSGGLDSTIIAYYAKKIFKNPIAICATFKSKDQNKIISKDMAVANTVAKALEIKIKNLFFDNNTIKNKLTSIIESAQDWRDYNIHCATLNYYIAKYLYKTNKNIPVLTGDLMNEYCADYETEYYDNKPYYRLPKIDKKILQRFLINGLDSSAREVSVFKKFNINLYQPYSIVSDDYKNLSRKLIISKNFKYKFNNDLISKKIFKLVSKKKNRAQITDDEGGILKYFIMNKLDQKKLESIFSKKFKISKLWMKEFILTGQYRAK